MSVYLIVQTNIKDRESYDELINEAIPIFSACNAKMLAANNDTKFLEQEGGIKYERTLIVRFESQEGLDNWYETIKHVGFLKRWRSASETYLVSYINEVDLL